MKSPSFLALHLRTARLTQLSRYRPLYRWKKCVGWSGGANCCVSTIDTEELATKRFAIPDPTWSVQSLQLNEAHPPSSMEELQRLAKRAVLDIRRLDDETRTQLCQDLGNMLHMIEHVQENEPTTAHFANTLDPVELYDIPRGVTAAPFRDDDDMTEDSKKIQEEEEKSALSVRTSFLEPKMTHVGGHQYFEVVTSVKGTTEH